VADITVQVSSPGLSVWGRNTWGELGFSNQVSSSASAGQVSAFNNQGWGRDYWGKLSWGVAYQNQQVEQSGFSLSSNLGTISISSEINLGWGRLEWGENAWGIGGDVIVDGQQLTSATGSVTTQAGASVQPTGINASFSIGTAVLRLDLDVIPTGISATLVAGTAGVSADANTSTTGSSASTAAGAVTVDAKIETGWGRGKWGNRAWGDTYSALLVGQELTSAQGTVIPRTDVSVTATSQQLLTLTQGQESIQIDADIFVFVGEPAISSSQGTTTEIGTASLDLTGVSATLAQGNTVGGTLQEVPVTMFGMSLTLGTFTLVQSTNEPVTGQAMTLGLGTPAEISQQIVGVTGQQLTSGIGSVTITGTANISLTGIALTSNIGSLNITAWAEIDLGVNNVWTEVDIAA
jgi:hypothetical protein